MSALIRSTPRSVVNERKCSDNGNVVCAEMSKKLPLDFGGKTDFGFHPAMIKKNWLTRRINKRRWGQCLWPLRMMSFPGNSLSSAEPGQPSFSTYNRSFVQSPRPSVITQGRGRSTQLSVGEGGVTPWTDGVQTDQESNQQLSDLVP